MSDERWRPVPGSHGYEVSNLGRVKGPRCVLKPSLLNSGYLGVKIATRGTTVHAAVALAFVGPQPTRQHTVNHKNGDKLDNRAENLEWMTQAENNRHAVDVLGRLVGRPKNARKADGRQPFTLDLKAAGFHDLRIEPRIGYVAWRAVDVESAQVLHCAALKELPHWIADRVPRMLAARNYEH